MHQLPELPYTLHTRKRSIALTWSALILITCIQVEFLYFLLRYGTSVGLNTALTVPTALLLGFSILAMLLRTWQLARRESKLKPIGGKWYFFDFFHWNMVLGFIIVTAVLSAATAEDPQNIRQASMPQAVILFLASSQLIVTGIMSKFGWRTPIRFSSTSRGEVMKPGVFVLIEDIVAVDGGGGQEFREALLKRYEKSEVFRKLVTQMNWFWGSGSMGVAAGVTAVVYSVEDENVVFALGWCLPWVWAGTGAICTVLWTKRMLDLEKNLGRSSQV
ncbi:hypothetical protein N431DRAFT_353302 [Stipitochalara longipes BDJ]|nr:hypothetical protein N431DRAFT_353302 [Stipitochalara longipes BDJ]